VSSVISRNLNLGGYTKNIGRGCQLLLPFTPPKHQKTEQIILSRGGGVVSEMGGSIPPWGCTNIPGRERGPARGSAWTPSEMDGDGS